MRKPLLSLFVLLFWGVAAAEIREDFPWPEELAPDVAFWKRIYTQVDTQGGLLHDNRYLDVVYAHVRFPEDASPQQRARLIDERRENIRDGLLTLASNPDSDDPALRPLRNLWGEEAGAAELRAAADRIRFQLGQSDRFRAGLERSGQWDPWIRGVMRERGVPEGMVALPHVESSYTPYARSRAGAAGMWQFTRGTGQRFMQVDHVVDERLDPWLAAEAAAELLRHNHEITGHWPLALTAYNHGAAGVRRAVSVMESEDIVRIAREYEGRRFGFASRNFYPAFLAALAIHAEPETHFDELVIQPPQPLNTVTLSAYLPVRDIAEGLGISTESLRRHNPALLAPVWDGRKHVPRGYPLRLPPDHDRVSSEELLAAVPADRRFGRQEADREHVVRRGETLSHIAGRYGTTVTELVRLNNLRNAHQLRMGQRLTLPGGRTAPTVEAVPEDGVYEVRRGDNLSLIAARFQVSLSRLRELNELESGDRIHPGQSLRLTEAEPAPAEVAMEEEPLEDPQAETVESGQAERALEPEALTALETDMTEEDADMITDDAGSLVDDQPELAADPSDYAVGSEGRITLQWNETLGHHADWLDLPTQRLRDLNQLAFGDEVSAGQSLRLDFSRVDVEEYEARRMAFHEAVQRLFFEQYQIVGVQEYTVASGDSLWSITRRAGGIPEWLIQQYNPDTAMDRLRPGQELRLPEVERSP